MKQNMGKTDRIVRGSIAFTILMLYVIGIQGTVGTILMVIAVVFTLTSLTGFCPLYAPFGISTCSHEEHHHHHQH